MTDPANPSLKAILLELAGSIGSELLRRKARELPNVVAIREEQDDGTFRDWTWLSIATAATQFKESLVSLGVKRGDRIAIRCEPRIEPIIAIFGAQLVGCIPFGLHTTASVEQISQIVADAAPSFVMTDNVEVMVESLGRSRMETLAGFCCTGASAIRQESAATVAGFNGTWEELLAVGSSASEAIETVDAAMNSDDVAFIIYTSGTTGSPKGVMLSWRGLILSLCGIFGQGGLSDPPRTDDRTLHEVGMATPTGLWFGCIYPLIFGCTAYIPSHRRGAEESRKRVQPTVYYGRPATWEGAAGKIEAEIRESSLLRRFGYRVLMALGTYILDRQKAGKGMNSALLWGYHILTPAVVGAALNSAGFGAARYALCGGAPLPEHVLRLWYCWGVTIRTFYGMTECSGVATVVSDDIPRLGTVGKPCLFSDVRLADDDEILIGGPTIFKGYFNRPEQTAQAVDADGFFHTGDLGQITDDGSIVMVDRKNNVVQLSTGEGVIVSRLESKLRASPFIAFAMVVGSGRPHLAALVEIDLEKVKGRVSTGKSMPYEEFVARNEVIDLIRSEIETCNTSFREEGRPTIDGFCLIAEPLAARDPELITATGKVRRANLIRRYEPQIRAIYGAQEAVPGGHPDTKERLYERRDNRVW